MKIAVAVKRPGLEQPTSLDLAIGRSVVFEQSGRWVMSRVRGCGICLSDCQSFRSELPSLPGFALAVTNETYQSAPPTSL